MPVFSIFLLTSNFKARTTPLRSEFSVLGHSKPMSANLFTGNVRPELYVVMQIHGDNALDSGTTSLTESALTMQKLIVADHWQDLKAPIQCKINFSVF